MKCRACREKIDFSTEPPADEDMGLCGPCIVKMHQPDDGRSSLVTEPQEGFTGRGFHEAPPVSVIGQVQLGDGFAMMEGYESAHDRYRNEGRSPR